MSKPIYKPKMYSPKEVYKNFVAQLLLENPEWYRGHFNQTYKLSTCYIYARENGKIVEKMSYPLWKEVVERFFNKAKYAIIKGEVLRLGSNLGKLFACRIQRDFRNKVINWAETFRANIIGDDGKIVKVYHTEEDYCRIRWSKLYFHTNEKCYFFAPTAKNMTTGKGLKAEFVDALRKDPFLKYKFKFYPLKS